MRAVLVLCLVSSAACVTSPAPAPCEARPIGLSLIEAQHVVSRFEAMQASVGRNDPLNAPKSLEDALEILRRDQIDLFSAGVQFTAATGGAEALALQAQLELAWGESQQILADMFALGTARLNRSVRALELRGDELDRGTLRRVQDLKLQASESLLVSEALGRLASEHVSTGASLARRVIQEKPSEYLGYRVAADYHRLRHDWPKFEEMVRRIEAANPDSIGLLFLRGVGAWYRDNDLEESRRHLRLALEKDPKFARAQVQLVLSAPSTEETKAELAKLAALNPNHQLIVWAKSLLDAAEEADGLARARPAPGR